MTEIKIRELELHNAELSVWGLKKAVLSKRQEVVDLELQVRQAEDRLKGLSRRLC
jgi:predicted  nucleic acid-binding Zn-ribbon protein